MEEEASVKKAKGAGQRAQGKGRRAKGAGRRVKGGGQQIDKVSELKLELSPPLYEVERGPGGEFMKLIK
ncbi:MAG: hypothetical protein A2X04_11740 [Bacteroidetes bacterium GWF2_41_9]|nr:MAG: hypothetical protein A2X04_11740 [Bacteroidetes bacterium GWF2_41_9]